MGVVAVLALIGAGFSGISLGRLLVQRRRARAEKSQQPLDEKLELIQTMGKMLSSLNQEIQAEFALQLAATKEAQRQAEDAAAIAALNEEGRRAAELVVASQIETALATNSKSERKFQVLVSLISFFAGVIATIIVSAVFQSLAA